MADSARAHLIFSFRKVLRPLIRILIRAGVNYTEFREVIKGAYVEAAVRDGIGKEGPVSRERVAVHTAVPIADVNRFIDDPKLLAPPDATNADVITEVLHIWNTDSNYLGPYGFPLEVDFDSTPGRNFCELVYRANPTVDPQVILDEMTETGLLIQLGATHYKASTRAQLFDEFTPQALEYFGRAMASLASTLQFNITVKGDGKRFQRSVYPDGGLPESALPEFEELVKERGQALLVEIDDWLSQNAHRWVERTKIVDTGLTLFHYVTEEADFRPLVETEGLADEAKQSRKAKRKA